MNETFAEIKKRLANIQTELLNYLKIIYEVNVKLNNENKVLKTKIESLERSQQVKSSVEARGKYIGKATMERIYEL